MKYLTAFTKLSVLKYNVDKTKVISICDFDKENKLCPDIELDWDDY